ncbi:serine protease [Allokutzneria sp. A3M-2-11 16]|uniref:trypsin-like serine peptidase n=1 Tax=Allokutzneria sp. A3M-2-11 16 TaxID=2962043 RepID=UPI0020B6E204|nr:serine protease [Allokutzneria sp. A3M-2-11 16]MCP3799224.1 serine protease [Allokutzneria sp. A3M-2-11 16]
MHAFGKIIVAATLALPAFVLTGEARSAPVEQGAQQVGTEEAVRAEVTAAGPVAVIDRAGSWYVKTHVTGLRLAPTDELVIADPKGSESYRYSAKPTEGDAPATPTDTGFWALSVTGDSAVVTLRAKDGGAPSPLSSARIDKITRGFTDAEFAARADAETRSICGTNDYKDAVCYKTSNPTEFSKTAAVAKLLRNGSSLCTGWRVGANNRMLTNNHCFSTNPQQIEVWFNYQCDTCGGTASGTVTKVLASQVLSTDYGLDYTLFSVTDFAKVQPFGTLELDPRVPDVGEKMYVVGHPAGKLKKVSLKDDQSASGDCQVFSVKVDGRVKESDIGYKCDTEGGSSGSPVLSGKTHKVISLHHYGGCPNQGVRIDLVHEKIKNQL